MSETCKNKRKVSYSPNWNLILYIMRRISRMKYLQLILKTSLIFFVNPGHGIWYWFLRAWRATRYIGNSVGIRRAELLTKISPLQRSFDQSVKSLDSISILMEFSFMGYSNPILGLEWFFKLGYGAAKLLNIF